jgi:hypothetical protein
MGFPEPPITQWKVESPTSMSGVYFRIVNFEHELADALDTAAEYGPPTVYGRRRMNDYVGSPIWSAWEQV